MDGIHFVTLNKSFLDLNSQPSIAGLPGTSKEAIKRIIKELQEIVKDA